MQHKGLTRTGVWVVNFSKNTVEIQFPKRPEPEVLERLRCSDFVFFWSLGIWRANDTPKNRLIADEVAIHEGIVGFKGDYAQRLRRTV